MSAFSPPRVDPNSAVMFEDLARNLEVPHALGMITVLVVPKGAGVVLREDWELAGRDEPHVDMSPTTRRNFCAVSDDLARCKRRSPRGLPRILHPSGYNCLTSPSWAPTNRDSRGSLQVSPCPQPIWKKTIDEAFESATASVRPPKGRCATPSRPRSTCSIAARPVSPSAPGRPCERHVEGQSVAQKGGAAVVPVQRHDRHSGRPCACGVVGQGAVEIR